MTTFFQDAFSGLAATALQAHTPDTGTSWLLKVGATPVTLDGSGHAKSGTDASFSTYMANTAPGTTDYFTQIDEVAIPGRYFPAARMSSDGLSFYYAKWTTTPAPGQYQLYKRVAGSDTFLGQGELAGATSVRIVTTNSGSSVVVDVYAGTAGGTLSLIFSFTDTVAGNVGGVGPFTSAGFAGFHVLNVSAVLADNFIAGTGTQPGVTPAVIGLTTPAGPNDTEVRLTASAAAGGTAALTYQWYRSPTPGFTPGAGTLLPGETSLALTDTPPDDDLYFYRIRATDATAATADSAVFGASLWESPLVIGYAGHSIYGGTPADGTEKAPAVITRNLQKVAGLRGVVGVNMASSGSTSGHWVPGQTIFDDALAAFDAASVDVVFFMIGLNDAPPGTPGSTGVKATVKANMILAVNAWRAEGYDVALAYQTPFFPPQDQTRMNTVELLHDAMDEIAATDPDHIHVIGQDAWSYIWSHPEEIYTDGAHPLARGGESIAAIHARDYAQILDPSLGGGGGVEAAGGFVYLPGGSA